MSARQILMQANRVLSKESPTILTVLAVGGVFSSVVMAIRATPRAVTLMDDARIYQNKEELTPLEILQCTWKEYLPTAIMVGSTVACIIGSNSINMRRNAALASIYAITETTLKEYQTKVKEIVGENKAAKIADEMSQDRLNNKPFDNKEVTIIGKGETLFYDSLSARYFKSDIESVRKAVNDFNRELNLDMYKTLNDFYDLLGLDGNILGQDNGWDTDYGLLDIHFSAKLADEKLPCIVLNYDRNLPRKL